MKITKTLAGMIAAASTVAAFSAPVMALDWKPVTDERLLNAAKDGNDWLIYGRDYAGSRYSPLEQITTANVGKLKLAWSSNSWLTRRPSRDAASQQRHHDRRRVERIHRRI